MKKIIIRLCLVLVIVEICLRVVGALYYSFWIHSYAKNSSGRIRILCLGESATFGVGASKENSYPSQLSRLLEGKYPGKFLVSNRGAPGITSTGILFNLKRIMAQENPNLVILQCGANEYNPHCATLSSLMIIDTKNSHFNQIAFRASYLLRNCRIYKLTKLIMWGFKYKIHDNYGCYMALNGDYKPINSGFSLNDMNSDFLIDKQYQLNMDQITATIRHFGAEVIYTTYLVSSVREEIKAASIRNKVILCDQVGLLQQIKIPLESLLTEDGFHPNKEGYRIAAEFLLKTLEVDALKDL